MYAALSTFHLIGEHMPTPKKKPPVAAKGAFPMWSAQAVFKLTNGGLGLAKLLKEHGLRAPSPVTLRVWLNRGFIPGFWMPTVCLALAKAKLCDNPLKLIVHANNAKVTLPDIFK